MSEPLIRTWFMHTVLYETRKPCAVSFIVNCERDSHWFDRYNGQNSWVQVYLLTLRSKILTNNDIVRIFYIWSLPLWSPYRMKWKYDKQATLDCVCVTSSCLKKICLTYMNQSRGEFVTFTYRFTANTFFTIDNFVFDATAGISLFVWFVDFLHSITLRVCIRSIHQTDPWKSYLSQKLWCAVISLNLTSLLIASISGSKFYSE